MKIFKIFDKNMMGSFTFQIFILNIDFFNKTHTLFNFFCFLHLDYSKLILSSQVQLLTDNLHQMG